MCRKRHFPCTIPLTDENMGFAASFGYRFISTTLVLGSSRLMVRWFAVLSLFSLGWTWLVVTILWWWFVMTTVINTQSVRAIPRRISPWWLTVHERIKRWLSPLAKVQMSFYQQHGFFSLLLGFIFPSLPELLCKICHCLKPHLLNFQYHYGQVNFWQERASSSSNWPVHHIHGAASLSSTAHSLGDITKQKFKSGMKSILPCFWQTHSKSDTIHHSLSISTWRRFTKHWVLALASGRSPTISLYHWTQQS